MEKIRNLISALKLGRIIVANAPTWAAVLFFLRFSDSIILSFLLLVAFFLFYSGIYIINDLFDLENDRVSETKKMRPIASGKVTVKEAWVLMLIVMMPTYIYIFLHSIPLGTLCTILLAINLLYSGIAKKLAYYDIILISSTQSMKFLVGVLVCGVAIPVAPSFWMLFGMLYFTFIALHSKKQLAELAWGHKKQFALGSYSVAGLERLRLVALGIGWVFLILGVQNSLWGLGLVWLVIMTYACLFISDTEGMGKLLKIEEPKFKR